MVRILGSRMAPSVVGDEQHLSQVIQKKLVREDSASSAARFADLPRRLIQMPKIQERWSIIYLLHMLNENSQKRTSVGAPVFSSAFHSLGLENAAVSQGAMAIDK